MWDSLSPFLSAPLLHALSQKQVNKLKKKGSTYGFGKTGQHPAKQNKNYNGPLSYNIHKNKSNTDKDLYVKPETIKSQRITQEVSYLTLPVQTSLQISL